MILPIVAAGSAGAISAADPGFTSLRLDGKFLKLVVRTPSSLSIHAMKNIDDLKSTGLKATLPRLKILEIFQAGKQRHMTAEDVFRVLLDERSDIGLATVYRVLTQFEQAGILLRSNFESGKAVYELDEGQHHDHFVCTSCGKVEEFYDPEIEKRQQMIADQMQWTIQDHSMSLYGQCKDCATKSKR